MNDDNLNFDLIDYYFLDKSEKVSNISNENPNKWKLKDGFLLFIEHKNGKIIQNIYDKKKFNSNYYFILLKNPVELKEVGFVLPKKKFNSSFDLMNIIKEKKYKDVNKALRIKLDNNLYELQLKNKNSYIKDGAIKYEIIIKDNSQLSTEEKEIGNNKDNKSQEANQVNSTNYQKNSNIAITYNKDNINKINDLNTSNNNNHNNNVNKVDKNNNKNNIKNNNNTINNINDNNIIKNNNINNNNNNGKNNNNKNQIEININNNQLNNNNNNNINNNNQFNKNSYKNPIQKNIYNNNLNNNLNINKIINNNIINNAQIQNNFNNNNLNNNTINNSINNNKNNINNNNINNNINNINNNNIYNNNFSNNFNLNTNNNNINNRNNYINNNNNLNQQNINSRYIFPIKGLDNIGSTCYMNSTLQCLLHVSELINYFINEYKNDKANLRNKNKNSSTNGNIPEAFYELVIGVCNINDGNISNRSSLNINCLNPKSSINIYKNKKKEIENNSFSPKNFKRILGYYNSQFKDFKANDSKDLLLYLLQTMHEELNYFGDNPPIRLPQPNQCSRESTFMYFMNIYNSQNFSIISKIFYGTYEIITTCHKCYTTIYNFQKFEFISFGMFKYKKKPFNIINGFRDNEEPQILEGNNKFYCNKCKMLKEASLTCRIIQPPNKLILNIDYGKNKKYHPSNISFEDTIDITKYVSFNFGKRIRYEITGICTHLGSSGEYGHYITFCKNKNNKKWYSFNDSKCNEVDKKEEIYRGSPYILLYEKID